MKTSNRTESLGGLQQVAASESARYPDPAADLEETLLLGARYSGETALQLEIDRKPTAEDIEIDASLQRIHQALDADKRRR